MSINEQSPPIPQPMPQIVYVENRNNSAAMAGLILGILGLLTGGLLAILFWFSWVLGLIGLIFAFVGLSKSKRTGIRKKMAIWAIVLNVLAIGSGFYGLSVTVSAVHNVSKSFNDYSACVDKAQTLDQMDACN